MQEYNPRWQERGKRLETALYEAGDVKGSFGLRSASADERELHVTAYNLPVGLGPLLTGGDSQGQRRQRRMRNHGHHEGREDHRADG
jgi:hypothetical protein